MILFFNENCICNYKKVFFFFFQITEDKVTELLNKEQTSKGMQEQQSVYSAVAQNIKKSQDKVRKRKEEKGHADNFQIGEMVLRKNIRQEQRKGGKMAPDMLGPFKIIKLEGKNADLITKKGKLTIKVNIDHLTHYTEPEERIPAKLKRLCESSPLAIASTSTSRSTSTSTSTSISTAIFTSSEQSATATHCKPASPSPAKPSTPHLKEPSENMEMCK